MNYLTAIGYSTPNFKPDEVSEMIHVVGKDIAKFHCIYWTAFLNGAGLPMPKMVINHGHWVKNKVRSFIVKILDENV